MYTDEVFSDFISAFRIVLMSLFPDCSLVSDLRLNLSGSFYFLEYQSLLVV